MNESVKIDIGLKRTAKTFKSTEKNLKLLGQKIQDGELVIFPTETVWGLGANALNGKAVSNIFKVKNRPQNNPLIVHCLGFYDAEVLCSLTSDERFWFKQITD